MVFQDLRNFINVLEERGELKRILVEVDPVLEITAIADRVSKRMGPALFFERVKGSKMPLLINALGTEERIKLALGVSSLEHLSQSLTDILETKTPESLLEKIRLLPRLKDLASLFPKRVKDGPCKEVIIKDNPSLEPLPILKCWPLDGGKFITLPLVFTKDPETGIRNCGIYRMQVYDEKTTGMHWHIHKGGAAHFRKYKRLKRRMDVAVAIGPDPATTFAAALPMPEGLDEMLMAGFLRKRPVEMVPCETIDQEVPANSEIILEGYIEPEETRLEGPFGDHTGFYSLPDMYPVFHLTCITHRRDPIYQSIVVGRPPMEDCHIGRAIERLFLPFIKKHLPEVVDIHLPFEGVFHNLLIVSIDKRYPGHARKVMHALWGLGQAMFTKVIVVVDANVDVHDTSLVAWKVLNNIDPERDMEFVMGPIDTLDHASRLPQYGSKVGIDATKKGKEEGFTRQWPEEIRMDEATRELVDKKWKDYGIGD